MTDESTFHVVLKQLLNYYVELPRNTMDALARDIAKAVLKHLHETGALPCPPGDLEES